MYIFPLSLQLYSAFLHATMSITCTSCTLPYLHNYPKCLPQSQCTTISGRDTGEREAMVMSACKMVGWQVVHVGGD